MKMNPVSQVPPVSEHNAMHSPMLIIQTDDGRAQTGWATFYKNRLHSWTVQRVKFENGQSAPDYMGDNFDLGCFEGVNVVAWAIMPDVRDIIMAM